MAHAAVPGLQPQTAPESLHGILVSALIYKRQTPHLIDVHHERVTARAVFTVLLGTPEILKREFCHRPVEIGLRQIGLGVYDLVEILDGEYVIVKIESGLAHRHHTVGVYLGLQRGA